jgi:hypothetical protein
VCERFSAGCFGSALFCVFFFFFFFVGVCGVFLFFVFWGWAIVCVSVYECEWACVSGSGERQLCSYCLLKH